MYRKEESPEKLEKKFHSLFSLSLSSTESN